MQSDSETFQLLSENREQLDLLANALLEHETLESADIARLFSTE